MKEPPGKMEEYPGRKLREEGAESLTPAELLAVLFRQVKRLEDALTEVTGGAGITVCKRHKERRTRKITLFSPEVTGDGVV